MKSFPFFRQHDSMDCGPTCLRMVAKYYGKSFQIQGLRQQSGIARDGVSIRGISEAAEGIGFRTMPVSVPLDKLRQDAPLPCIVHWQQNHFVVVYAFKTARFRKVFNRAKAAGGGLQSVEVCIADPGKGLRTISVAEFCESWVSTTDIHGNPAGVALLLEPTPAFYQTTEEARQGLGLGRLLGYLRPYRHLIGQLGLGLLVGSGLQLLLPFLTQSIGRYRN